MARRGNTPELPGDSVRARFASRLRELAMRKILPLLAICVSTPLAAQAQDYRIIHSYPTEGAGYYGVAFGVGADWQRQFDHSYQTQGAEAALPVAAREARDGNPVAMRLLGLAYARGEGVARDDEAAFAWFRKAAARGDATSMYALGLAYWHGTGVTRNRVTAEHWLIA